MRRRYGLWCVVTLLLACQDETGVAGRQQADGSVDDAGTQSGASRPDGGALGGRTRDGAAPDGSDGAPDGVVDQRDAQADTGTNAPEAGGDRLDASRAGRDGALRDSGGPRRLALRFEDVALDQAPDQFTHLRFIPGTQQLLVLTKGGTLLHYELNGDQARLLGSVEFSGVHEDLDCGLISLTFDPDFDDNRWIYLGMCFSQQESGIVRAKFTPSDYPSIADSVVEIHRVGDPDANRPWHNVGEIGFDPSGNLWALYGDKNRRVNAQDLSNELGALVRLRPSASAQGGFEPAEPPNPFSDASASHPLIYAYGMRSPWTGLLDSHGHYVFADVGSNDIEEVNVITHAGQNFGWGLHEGPCTSDCESYVDPIRHWDRSSSHPFVLDDPKAAARTARVGWVGVEYTPRTNDRYEGLMDGKILYGDMCVGFVRALELDAKGELVFDAPVGHLAGASGWELGPDGYIYAVSFRACTSNKQVHPGRLVRAVLDR